MRDMALFVVAVVVMALCGCEDVREKGTRIVPVFLPAACECDVNETAPCPAAVECPVCECEVVEEPDCQGNHGKHKGHGKK